MTEHKIPEILNALGFTAVDADSDVGKDAALILHALGFTDGYVATPEARANARGAVTRLVSRLDTLERERSRYFNESVTAQNAQEVAEARLRAAEEALEAEPSHDASDEFYARQTKVVIRRARAALAGVQAPALANCADHPGETEWPDSGCAKCNAESGVQAPAGEERKKREEDWGEKYAADAVAQAPAGECRNPERCLAAGSCRCEAPAGEDAP